MPPEFTKCNPYVGCQGTVWQMGILLVDMLSPETRAFEHPSDALLFPPKVPSSTSITRSEGLDLLSVEHKSMQPSNSETNPATPMVCLEELRSYITVTVNYLQDSVNTL